MATKTNQERDKFVARSLKARRPVREPEQAALKAEFYSSEGVDAGGEPRQFACDRILVHDPFCRRPVQFGLRNLECRLSRIFVAGRNRGLDLLDEGADATHPRAVDDRTLLGLAKAFFSRFVMRHLSSS